MLGRGGAAGWGHPEYLLNIQSELVRSEGEDLEPCTQELTVAGYVW